MTRLPLSTYMFRRDGLIGTAILRVALATIMLIGYLWEVPWRFTMLGRNAQLDYADYVRVVHPGPLGLYLYAQSNLAVDVVFFASILIAAAYGLGLFPRIMAWLFAITTFANLSRGALDSDGGRALLLLMAFLLCFADSSRYFTLFRLKRIRSSGLMRAWSTMLHNSAYFLIRWQVCMVYTWAVFYKMAGPHWRDGTAMAYILRADHFLWFPALSGGMCQWV
jgi:hypothetical protein